MNPEKTCILIIGTDICVLKDLDIIALGKTIFSSKKLKKTLAFKMNIYFLINIHRQ